MGLLVPLLDFLHIGSMILEHGGGHSSERANYAAPVFSKAHILWVFLELVPEFCSREAQTYDPATFVVSFALVET